MILDQHGNPMGSKPYIVPATPKQVAEWGYGYEYAYGGGQQQAGGGGAALGAESVLDSQSLQESGQGTLVDPGGNITFNNTDDPGMIYEATSGEATWYSDVKCNDGNAFVRCALREHTISNNSRAALPLFYSINTEDNAWEDSNSQDGYVLFVGWFQTEIELYRYDSGSRTELAAWGDIDPSIWLPNDADDGVIELEARYDEDEDWYELRIYVTPATGTTDPDHPAGERFEFTNTDGRGRVYDASYPGTTDTYAGVTLDPASSSGQNLKARDFEHGVPAEEAASSAPYVIDLTTGDGILVTNRSLMNNGYSFDANGFICQTGDSTNVVDNNNLMTPASGQIDANYIPDTGDQGYAFVYFLSTEEIKDSPDDTATGISYIQLFINGVIDQFILRSRDSNTPTDEATENGVGKKPSDFSANTRYRITYEDQGDGTIDVTVVADPDGSAVTIFDAVEVTKPTTVALGRYAALGMNGANSGRNDDGGFTYWSHQ